jgi:hypothetical protein
MTFEQIIERHLAGDTNLFNETKFIFETQGEAAARDFARGVDEAIGEKSFLLVTAHIEKLKEAANAPKFNEKAAAESELYKQQIQRDKIAKQDAERVVRNNIENERNAPALPIVEKPKKPLFESPALSGGLGLDRDRLKESDKVYNPNFTQPNKNLLIFGGILVIIAAYFYFKKGK